MIKISVSTDVKKLTRHLQDVQRKQIPFATALALTAVAKHAQDAVTKQLPSIFDNPTPFTMRAIAVEAASKKTLTAAVFVRPIQAQYLALEETGGIRTARSGKSLPEPVDIALNKYGNIARNKIKQLAAKPGYFIATIDGVRGLYQRPKDRTQPLKLLVRFVAGWSIKPKFRFHERAAEDVRKVLPEAMQKALARALK